MTTYICSHLCEYAAPSRRLKGERSSIAHDVCAAHHRRAHDPLKVQKLRLHHLGVAAPECGSLQLSQRALEQCGWLLQDYYLGILLTLQNCELRPRCLRLDNVRGQVATLSVIVNLSKVCLGGAAHGLFKDAPVAAHRSESRRRCESKRGAGGPSGC